MKIRHVIPYALCFALAAGCGSDRPRQQPREDPPAASPQPDTEAKGAPEGLGPDARRYVDVASALGCMAFDASVEDVHEARGQVLLSHDLDEASYLELSRVQAPTPEVQARLAKNLAQCGR